MPTLNCAFCNAEFENTHPELTSGILNPHYHYLDFIGYRPVCQHCLNTKFTTCPDCGKRMLTIGATVNKGLPDEHGVCYDCLSNYRRCSDCGDYFSTDHLDEHGYCERCAANYVPCSVCGDMVRREHARTRNGNYYCSSCYEDSFRKLRRYGYKPYDERPIFWRADGETEEEVAGLYFGIEQETDSGYNRDDYCLDLAEHSENDKLFVMKEDSSLDNGVEIVSYPCSMRYFNEAYPFDKIREIANKYDYVSHNSGNCGLHIHVSRAGLGNTSVEQDLAIAKIMFLFDKFWDNIFKFSRRRNSRWCYKPDAKINPDDLPAVAIDKAKVNQYDHCRAVNLQHNNTVEFRVFRGSLNPVTVKASIQFVYLLCKWVMSHSLLECQNVTWDELVASDYEELNAYLEHKNLKAASVEETA